LRQAAKRCNNICMSSAKPATAAAGAKHPRLALLDVARGAALIAMASYHFTWDLEFFGYTDPGMTAHGPWKFYARCIASSFLFLVGVSLFLAHSGGIRWPGFLRRLAMVGGAALAITFITYFAVPGGFIFFGILHEIALASLLGLAFLRLPAIVTLALAAIVIAAPTFARSPLFDHAALWWVGLSSVDPRSNDYVPVFPWFGAVLAGIGSAKLAASFNLFERLAAVKVPQLRLLQFAGRHSLAFYLVHQPILIGCLWLFAQIFPADVPGREVQFRRSCEAECVPFRGEEFCARYCVCMLEELESSGSIDAVFADEQSAATRAALQTVVATCSERTDATMGEQP
jgi:uncharacterized membrane protein